MEFCDGIHVFFVPMQPLGKTIMESNDPPDKIGFCFSKPCSACQYPCIPGMEYFLQDDVCFIVALLRSDFILSMCIRRWDLIERVLLYVGYDTLEIFNAHRANVFNPLDRMYSFFCLFPVSIVNVLKLSQYECDALLQFARPRDGVTKTQMLRFMSKNSEKTSYYMEKKPKKEDLHFIPENLVQFLAPNKVVLAGGAISQMKTPWTNVLPSSDLDVFVLNGDKNMTLAIVSSFDEREYFACKSSASVVTLIPKINCKKVVQVILHEATSTKDLLETFDICGLKIAFDNMHLVYPFVAISDWEERKITSCNCVISPRRFLKMYLKGYKISQTAKEYMGKMLGENGVWPLEEEVLADVRDTVYMANPHLSTSSNKVLLRALGFTFDINTIIPMLRTMNNSYTSSISMNIISWEAFTKDRSIMNFSADGPSHLKMIMSDSLMQMPLVVTPDFATDSQRQKKLQIIKEKDYVNYALLQAVIRNGIDNKMSIDECIAEYMQRPFKDIMFVTCPDSIFIQDGIPQKRIFFSGKMQIVAQLHVVSCSNVVWKIHSLTSQ